MDGSTPSAKPGHCRITIQGSDTSFEMKKGELLLLAALEQGIDYPHNCRVGTCGSCKTHLVDGRISPLVDFALSPLTNQQLKDGYVLACQAKVRGDLTVNVKLGKHALLPVKSLSSRVVGYKKLPGEVLDLRLKLDEPMRFNAGQFATIAASGSFVRRSYSFYDLPPSADSAGATEVGFLVKRLPGGKFSEWLFAEDRSDFKIWLEAPFGAMGIDDPDLDGLCVAGGTGLAPILSIVADRLARSATARFTIVFGVRTAADDFAKLYLDALIASAKGRVRVVNILSHEPKDSGWQGARGFVTDALSADLGVDYGKTAAFICGSLPMVEAVEKKLLGLGVSAECIHADKFLPAR